VAIAAVAAIGGAIVVDLVAARREIDLPYATWIAPFMIAAVAAPAGVGVFVVARRPGNRIGWVLLGGALAVGVILCADAIARLELGQDRSSALGAWAGLVAMEWPAFFVWPLLLAYLYPSGAASLAAVAGPVRAGLLRDRRRPRPAAPADASRGAFRGRCEPAADRHRGLRGRLDLLAVLRRPAHRPVRRCRGDAPPLPAGAR
jgi:hypothetical protein